MRSRGPAVAGVKVTSKPALSPLPESSQLGAENSGPAGLKVTVPSGVSPSPALVTVAVQVESLPTNTLSGEQLRLVVVRTPWLPPPSASAVS